VQKKLLVALAVALVLALAALEVGVERLADRYPASDVMNHAAPGPGSPASSVVEGSGSVEPSASPFTQ
jgi:hypothetical protein